MIAKDRVGPTMSQGSLSRDELGGINIAIRHSTPQRKCVKEQNQEREEMEKNRKRCGERGEPERSKSDDITRDGWRAINK